jgi:hypothetical protein
MSLLRLDQDNSVRCAALAHTAAEEILHPVIGDTNEPIIVAVKVIGMCGETGLDRLHTGRLIMHQPNVMSGC